MNEPAGSRVYTGMKRLLAVMSIALVASSLACGSNDDGAAGSPKPTKTPKPFKEGGVRKMEEIIVTAAGSRIVVTNWVRGAPKRPDAPGPGQQYQSIGVGFCPGPTVDVTGTEVAGLFFLELPGGETVGRDQQTGKSELSAKGKITPGECVLLPVVFQVGGGRKPTFVLFRSRPQTKWKVP